MGMVVAQRHGAAASAPQQARRHQIPRESATSRFGRAASHVKTAHYVVRPSLKSTQLPPSSIISTSSMRSSSEYPLPTTFFQNSVNSSHETEPLPSSSTSLNIELAFTFAKFLPQNLTASSFVTEPSPSMSILLKNVLSIASSSGLSATVSDLTKSRAISSPLTFTLSSPSTSTCSLKVVPPEAAAACEDPLIDTRFGFEPGASSAPSACFIRSSAMCWNGFLTCFSTASLTASSITDSS
mmetsp:Transcript_4329/g.11542  ORF Transcript_4329/g.11542 Transcript_4329/m.11542 type:complete len:240 (+) Transcript_4329:267-986(+)